MTVLSSTIRLRAPGEMVSAAEAWAQERGETLSGMVRRLIEDEVPALGKGDLDPAPSDAANLVSDLLAGEVNAGYHARQVVSHGTQEQRDALLVALVGYFTWEYRAPPAPAEVQDMIRETERLLADRAN